MCGEINILIMKNDFMCSTYVTEPINKCVFFKVNCLF